MKRLSTLLLIAVLSASCTTRRALDGKNPSVFALRLVWNGTNEPAEPQLYDQLVVSNSSGQEVLWVRKEVELDASDIERAVTKKPEHFTREWFNAMNRQGAEPLLTEEDIQRNLDLLLVQVEFTPAGGKKLAVLTRENIGERLAIVIGDKVVIAPVIMAPIEDGSLEIMGDYDAATAEDLARKLHPTAGSE